MGTMYVLRNDKICKNLPTQPLYVFQKNDKENVCLVITGMPCSGL